MEGCKHGFAHVSACGRAGRGNIYGHVRASIETCEGGGWVELRAREKSAMSIGVGYLKALEELCWEGDGLLWNMLCGLKLSTQI